MSDYLHVCATIVLYVGFTLGALAAIVVGFSTIGFVVMGVINLIDEFRE